ncbi:MAG: hypothetical protein EOL89_00150 [Actinobacteria bacterium]|nr:hypothetical protein [Actinomycetota bacterium]
MSILQSPNLPDDHPRSMYVANLRAGESITWYTTEAPLDTLIAYVLELLDLDRTELEVSDVGFYFDKDETLMLTAIQGPWGGGLTAWGLEPSGTSRINDAINTEWDAVRTALSTGNYMGNPARSKYAIISQGSLTADWDGSPLIDYINDSSPVHLWSFMRD